MEKIEIEKLALQFAESKERAGCAYFNGLYRGYIAGYEAREGKPVPDTEANDNKHAVIKSVCDCGKPIDSRYAPCCSLKCWDKKFL